MCNLELLKYKKLEDFRELNQDELKLVFWSEKTSEQYWVERRMTLDENLGSDFFFPSRIEILSPVGFVRLGETTWCLVCGNNPWNKVGEHLQNVTHFGRVSGGVDLLSPKGGEWGTAWRYLHGWWCKNQGAHLSRPWLYLNSPKLSYNPWKGRNLKWTTLECVPS